MVARNTAMNAAETFQETAQNYASDVARRTQETFQSTVDSSPASAVLVSFGAGLVLGVIATQLLAPSKPQIQADAENFTQRLIDNIRASIPNSWSDTFRR